MDRFSWNMKNMNLFTDEQTLVRQDSVKLYDGDNQTPYLNGDLELTTLRLIWTDSNNPIYSFYLDLSLVIFSEQIQSGFGKSPKIVLHLNSVPENHPAGPVSSTNQSYIRLSFKNGGQTEVSKNLSIALNQKHWMKKNSRSENKGSTSKVRTGIVGIERVIQKKHVEAGQDISQAFEDMNKLMAKAKDMVLLSQNISAKIHEKHGSITEDETVRFKSYLLSLGVSDPVTRDTHGTGLTYFSELAKQLASMLQQTLEENGGLITLTDAYCRVNRARGMELLSPDDLVNSCKLMESLNLPMRLKSFKSGVMVLQLVSQSEENLAEITTDMVCKCESLSAHELSKQIGISVLLSKERLLSAEKLGKLCRDETAEGLRFYENLFLKSDNMPA